jgi:hypothetical protein
MSRIVLTALVLLAASPVHAAPPQVAGDKSTAPVNYRSEVVDKYCVTCHNARLKTGGLVLENVDVTRPNANADIWEKVVRKVRSGAMPPLNARRPDKAILSGFVSYLTSSLDAAAVADPNPGRPIVHRLNRAEYTNAVRDLLGVEIDGRAQLPADDASYGFDNVADVLSVSPALLDRYLLVARKISSAAVGDPRARPMTSALKLSEALLQADRMSEDLPFGTRGGVSFDREFPADGEYRVQLRLQRSSINALWAVRGLDEDTVINFFVDGVPVKEFPITGMNRMNIAQNGDPTGGEIESKLNVRLPVKAGPHRLGVAMVRSQWYFEGVGVGRLPLASDAYEFGWSTNQNNGKIDLGIDTVEIAGPFNASPSPSESLSRRRIFVCKPVVAQQEDACASRILSTLARRAYRRPVSDADVSRLMEFYRAGRSEGSFDDGVQAAIERLLVSPYFLLRKEQDPKGIAAGAAYTISDIELASRLSFFLWSSIPDDELLSLAEARKLSDPVVLQRQVARMLRDERTNAFVQNFFGQWLYLRNLDAHRPDLKLYPEFDETLRDAFRRETELFIESQLSDDRSALELLTANYTFVNERLAKYYGIPNVSGSHFRRVALPDGPRAGLLGQGSVLAVTSYPDRTSPVLRGKFLLENIIGAPPPPPPADVPPFPQNKEGEAPQTVRARMEVHRRNPVCASCHSIIDPLGFALENFNAIGQYRTSDGGATIDPSGVMPDGTKFSGPVEFRKALLQRREELMMSLSEKMLTYALGRGLEFYDMPAIRRVTRDAAMQDYRWSAIIAGLIRSTPFRMRRGES